MTDLVEKKYHLEDTPSMVQKTIELLIEINSRLDRIEQSQNPQINSKQSGFMTTKEAVEYFSKDESWIRRQCSKGNIKGTFKMGKEWMMPKNAELINQTQNQ